MHSVEIRIGFSPSLHVFLTAAHRGTAEAPASVRCDGVSSLGHVVESLGVPLTEVGGLRVDGRAVDAGHVPADGESIEVAAVAMPQRIDTQAGGAAADVAPRFLLDIHLGTLARRMRLLGLDTAYENPDIGDAALAARSAAERRIMLSRDRGLLRRRELFAGAFVYSHRPDEQLDGVLARFAPPLAPWTRCTACNGELTAVAKDEMRGRLPDGTERTYDTFAECTVCGQAYWRGAHYERLSAIVEHAQRRVEQALAFSGPGPTPPRP